MFDGNLWKSKIGISALKYFDLSEEFFKTIRAFRLATKLCYVYRSDHFCDASLSSAQCPNP